MSERPCTCMTEDPGDGFGERVVTHSSGCPQHPEYNPEPWSLVDFWEGADGSEGVTATVEIPGYERLVRIEHWYTRNSAGVDVYDDAGNEVSVAVEEHLGEQAYEYLTGDWLYEVERAYFDALNPAKEAAVEVARRVPVEIPEGGDE